MSDHEDKGPLVKIAGDMEAKRHFALQVVSVLLLLGVLLAEPSWGSLAALLLRMHDVWRTRHLTQ